jgi:hypothetical protein
MEGNSERRQVVQGNRGKEARARKMSNGIEASS